MRQKKKASPLSVIMLVLITGGILVYTMNNFNRTTNQAAQQAAAALSTPLNSRIVFQRIDPQFNTTPLDGSSPLEQAATAITAARIRSLIRNEAVKLIDVLFTTGTDKVLIERELTAIFCALQPHVPPGYRVRLAGKLASDVTVVTAIVAADRVPTVDCAAPLVWPAIADYSLASGLK
jgi:hypothetical protein